jgi:nuclear-control-of-ATPase protein 2
MGNSSSSPRNYLYWGALLLLITPLPTTNGWNIPYFGGGDQKTGPSTPSSSSSIQPAAAAVGGNADDKLAGVAVSTPSSEVGGGSSIANMNHIPRLSAIMAPMIGPADAPHLRFIPSYLAFSPSKLQHLLPQLLSQLQFAKSTLLQIVWYKPPVGIVGAYSFLRVLERLYGVIRPPPPTSGEEALADAEEQIELVGKNMKSFIPSKSSLSARFSPWGISGSSSGGSGGMMSRMYSPNTAVQYQMQKIRKKRRRKVRYGRSFDLDIGDRLYSNYGGIETVRVRACQEGLRCALSLGNRSSKSSSSTSASPAASNNNLTHGKNDVDDMPPNLMADIKIASNALQLSCPPKGSRAYFVEQSIEALLGLSKYNPSSPSSKKYTTPSASSSIHEQNIHLLLRHSSKLIEIRALDALLRTLRDRHLIVSARLRRTCDYWKWHVNLSGGRLGRILGMIQSPAQKLFPSWVGFDFRDQNQQVYEIVTATYERELEWLGRVERLLLERPAEMEVGELLSVVPDTSQQRSVPFWKSFVNDKEEKDDDGENLMLESSLSKTVQYLSQSKNRMWLKQTEEWSKEVRAIIKDSLDETVRSSFTPVSDSGGVVVEGVGNAGMMQTDPSELYAESKLLKLWASYDDNTSDAYSWLTVLTLVDCAASVKRSGERRHFQLSSIATLVRQYDFLRIPSSALLIAAANSLHDNIIAPHKQEILDFIKSIFVAIWGIIEFRFYTPMKDIVLDLLNRRPRMVDPFALLNEQTSLDNMLRDLGVGDGTMATRATALAAASRIYEQEVSGGAIRGIIKGRVPQLMLIQIQQLKADLLQAMDQIDNLVDANRLNVQLVASIPALLIIIFGTRALFLFWSNIRMKDFRLPRTVHAEMSDYLKRVEECLVLSNCQHDASASTTIFDETEVLRNTKAETCLRPKEMGQLLLLLHSYLNLLDYMSPPFPGKTCDSIHQSVQNLLMQGQMSTSRQLGLLKVIQSKHDDLVKSF